MCFRQLLLVGWEDLGVRESSKETSCEGREIIQRIFGRSGVGKRLEFRMSLGRNMVDISDFARPGSTPRFQVQNPNLVLGERIIAIGKVWWEEFQ